MSTRGDPNPPNPPIGVKVLFFSFSPNRPTGLIRSSSWNVCVYDYIYVPLPCDSPREAKEVPGEQSCLQPWHQYPEQMYIKKCTSLRLAVCPPPPPLCRCRRRPRSFLTLFWTQRKHKISVLLSASVERFRVSRMQIFFFFFFWWCGGVMINWPFWVPIESNNLGSSWLPIPTPWKCRKSGKSRKSEKSNKSKKKIGKVRKVGTVGQVGKVEKIRKHRKRSR